MRLRRNGTRYSRLIETFEEMYLANLSTRDIARLLNVSKSAVAKRLKDIEVTRSLQEAANLASYKYTKQNPSSSRTSRNQARKIMEKLEERELHTFEHVHHIDENPFNNNIDNLEVKPNYQHIADHKRRF